MRLIGRYREIATGTLFRAYNSLPMGDSVYLVSESSDDNRSHRVVSRADLAVSYREER